MHPTRPGNVLAPRDAVLSLFINPDLPDLVSRDVVVRGGVVVLTLAARLLYNRNRVPPLLSDVRVRPRAPRHPTADTRTAPDPYTGGPVSRALSLKGTE